MEASRLTTAGPALLTYLNLGDIRTLSHNLEYICTLEVIPSYQRR